jgi:predicted Holliday junction resolvase-like endonuclease
MDCLQALIVISMVLLIVFLMLAVIHWHDEVMALREDLRRQERRRSWEEEVEEMIRRQSQAKDDASEGEG